MRLVWCSSRIVATAIAVCVALNAAGLRADQFDDVAEAALREQKVPGMAIAVLQNGKVLKAGGYGYANVEHKIPVQRATIFQSGSLGKQFAATAVMLLAEDGKIKLDDRVSKYLPEAPKSWHDMTVRHLLSHTAGVPEIEDSIDLRKDYSDDELLRIVGRKTLAFAPGEQWRYSNAGYVVLGILITKVSGEFYGDFIKKRVFQPARMSTARMISDADIVPHRAAGYRFVASNLKNQEWVSPTFNRTADGSIYFSIDDLIAWDKALRSQQVLKPDSLRQMWTPIELKNGKKTDYGFGWFVRTIDGRRLVHHAGEWQGFTSYIRRYLDDGLTIAVLMNAAGPEKAGEPGGRPEDVAKQLVQLVFSTDKLGANRAVNKDSK